MGKIEITQKELDKKIGEARLEGYEIGKKESLYPKNINKSIIISKFIDALFELFDERYEFKEEDY